ncbi:MAG: manganese-binding transcriptional regulator MntR [Planctomycetota bacterium]|nr:manganese-binding transcriptional regulator MntR [Planctomycetota bacterium]
MPQRRPAEQPDDAARFRRTRDAHALETAEDYVEAIAHLIETHGEARVRDLSRLMGVSHVTVSRIVARIAGEGLVELRPYKPLALTAAGKRLARRARERHERVLAFLLAIGVGREQAQIDAEGIEHHVSEETIRAMERIAAWRQPGGGAS